MIVGRSNRHPSETTSTALTWAVLFMAKHPDVQKKVQVELDQVCGTQSPSLADKNMLPYTEARITEILRRANILPMSLFHAVTEDTTVMGYNLPKGTQIIPSIGVVMLNEKEFPEPLKFLPERHLDNGKFLPHPHVIPFGTGKRCCLGETLEKSELFLFFTGLLQKFTIKSMRYPELVDDSPQYGFTTSPKNFSVKVELRC
jgi:cytochrome P450